jgi:predicted MFS family arabinose efflux permease
MDNLSKFIPLFLSGGWIVLLIGAAGMTARLATSKNPEDKSPAQIVSNIIASMVASLIAWFIMEQFEVASMYKAIAYGLVGLNSPELLTGIIKISTSFANNPTEFMKNIKTGGAPPPKKRIVKKSKPKPRIKKG